MSSTTTDWWPVPVATSSAGVVDGGVGREVDGRFVGRVASFSLEASFFFFALGTSIHIAWLHVVEVSLART